jgi:hypothetical protein
MSERSLTAKSRLAAICMLVSAVVMIGWVLSGALQNAGRLPVAQVATK